MPKTRKSLPPPPLWKSPLGFESTMKTNKKTKKNKISNIENERQLVKQLHKTFAPRTVKPCDDFYSYINYTWLRNTRVEKDQKYIVQVDDFRLSQDRVFRQLEDIIKRRLHDGPHDAFHKRLHSFYLSILSMNPVSHSRQLAQQSVAQVDELLHKTPWDILAFFTSNEASTAHSPLSFSIQPDEKEPTINRCNLSPHQFFVIDPDLYEEETRKTGKTGKGNKKEREITRLKNNFLRYVQTVFDISLPKGHGFRAEDVLEAEREMNRAMGKCAEKRTLDKQGNKIPDVGEEYYNRVFAAEALPKYGFDWEAYTRDLGFHSPPPFFIVGDLQTFACLTDLLVERYTHWRTYWVFLLLRKIVRFTGEWHHLPYEFYGKIERGQEQIEASHVFVANYMSLPFNSFLTKEYVNRYEDPRIIQYVQSMCDDMKIVFRRLLERCDWMSQKTKTYAYKKLDHFRFILGHPPDVMAEDPELDYTPTSLFEHGNDFCVETSPMSVAGGKTTAGLPRDGLDRISGENGGVPGLHC